MKYLIFWFFFVFSVSLISSQEKIIKTGDEWQYYDEATPPGMDWNKRFSPTENWKSGPSPLGYGNDSVVTNISFGDDPDNKHITKYFKKTFRIENPHDHLVYKLNILRDDGIVLYLNGYEVFRNNMPIGEITNETKANSLVLSKRIESIPISKLLFPDDFNPGINTFSVSIHQARETSSDCLFNLELVGDDNTKTIPLLLRERTVKNLNLELRIKDLNHKQELEKKDQHMGFIKESNENLWVGIYIVSFLLLMLLLGAGYLIWYYIKKRKILLDKEKLLQEGLQDKDRKLMSSSLNTIQNQQFLKELKQNLSDSLSENAAVAKQQLKGIIRKIDYNLEHDEEWFDLINNFNTVHVGFVDKLSKLHPSLTETEQRHCMFIKLHLQTKEIAQILHIDPRSVQAARYRIKKKMDLGESIDLRDYILKL